MRLGWGAHAGPKMEGEDQPKRGPNQKVLSLAPEGSVSHEVWNCIVKDRFETENVCKNQYSFQNVRLENLHESKESRLDSNTTLLMNLKGDVCEEMHFQIFSPHRTPGGPCVRH